MPRKPTTLWRPEDSGPVVREYFTCADSTCIKQVGRPGDKCPDHQPKPDETRVPANLKTF